MTTQGLYKDPILALNKVHITYIISLISYGGPLLALLKAHTEIFCGPVSCLWPFMKLIEKVPVGP